MKKPIIAIDIDDVLAKGTDALRLQVNAATGVNLGPEHYRVKGEYWGYYETVWKQHGLSVDFDAINAIMVTDQSHVQPYDDAFYVLQKLADRYDFVIVTARNTEWREATLVWLEQHFPGLFSAVHFAGSHGGGISKGQLCKEIGASWLIDDNIDHAHTAIECGINVVLFGQYGWHIDKEIHEDVMCCSDWSTVLERLDGKSR